MIIGLAGYARTGKDTIADYLVEKHGFVRMAFADPMREALYRLDPKITVGGMPGMSLAHAVDKLGWEQLKELSEDIRPLLQRMGTEVGRQMFGEDFWVDQAMLRAGREDKVVFADVRFKNEAYAVGRNWGYLWRVTRPGVGPANGHRSETDLDDYEPIDSEIENDGDLKSLYRKVDQLIEEIYG